MLPEYQKLSILQKENEKLKAALSALIPWAGERPDGPDWATPQAKKINREMFDRALMQAVDCFPPDYGQETIDRASDPLNN